MNDIGIRIPIPNRGHNPWQQVAQPGDRLNNLMECR